MGIGPSLYHKIVTPFDVIQTSLREQDTPIFKETGMGNKAFVITRKGDLSILDDTDVEAVEDIEQADFVLLMGMDYPKKTLEHYDPVIRRAIQRRLKAVCCNQDSKSLIGNNFLFGPALLARRYEDAGGIVNYIGKPNPPIFRHCIGLLQEKEIYPSHDFKRS